MNRKKGKTVVAEIRRRLEKVRQSYLFKLLSEPISYILSVRRSATRTNVWQFCTIKIKLEPFVSGSAILMPALVQSRRPFKMVLDAALLVLGPSGKDLVKTFVTLRSATFFFCALDFWTSGCFAAERFIKELDAKEGWGETV